MGNSCHCLSNGAEPGPVLDIVYKGTKGQVMSYAPEEADTGISETGAQMALKVYFARKRLSHVMYLRDLERTMKTQLCEEARRRFEELGPYQHLTDPCMVLRLQDGSVYFGEVDGGAQPKGRGCLIAAEGSITEGTWVDAELEGAGRAIYVNGDVFEVRRMQGEWHLGEIEGQGRYIAAGGSIYEGGWTAGKQCGPGKETWPDGAVYTGNFSSGLKHGRGVFVWADGSQYAGEFRRNNLEGHGMYCWADGRVYSGQWKDSKMHGRGTFRWPDGKMYEGDYESDKKHGNGEFTWPDGKKYRGSWVRNKMHGRGFQYIPNIGEKQGEWHEGVRVRWINE